MRISNAQCGDVRIVRCLVLILGLFLTGLPLSSAADCSTILDPLAKAQCAQGNIAATGALNPATVNTQQGATPQYGGSTGCTNESCAGASQSGYYSNTGNIGPLNAAGTGAYATDSKAAQVRDMDTQAKGWNAASTSPVMSAQSVASGWTNVPQTSQTCVNNPICIEYVAAPTAPVTCTMPGMTRVFCDQNYSPSLKSSACGLYPLTSPPYADETFIDGCAPYAGLISANQAILVSQACTDATTRVLACNDYSSVSFLMPTSQAFARNSGSGTWTGYYAINYGIPTPDGFGGYTLQFSVSGNAVGENKYGCTNGQYGGGTWTMSPGQTVSGPGWVNYCNRKCGCFGTGVSFTLGAVTWTTPSSFTIPFTYSLGGIASGTINILGGLVRNSYSVNPLTGCWQMSFAYNIPTQIPDSCQPYRDAGCTQLDSVCTELDPVSGTCRVYTNTFQCNGGQVCSKWQDNLQCNSCGTPGSLVPFCMPTGTPPNTNFQLAATMMAMVKEVQDGFDKDTLRIFTGTAKRCDYSTIGTILIDCCSNDPDKMLGSCSAEEISLAQDKKAFEVIYVGTRCVEKVIGICTRKEDAYCTYTSMLGRIIQQQGKPQLGLNFGTPGAEDCDGFTLNEFASINFQAINWTEFFAQITTTFDSAAVSATMKTKACAMSGSTC